MTHVLHASSSCPHYLIKATPTSHKGNFLHFRGLKELGQDNSFGNQIHAISLYMLSIYQLPAGREDSFLSRPKFFFQSFYEKFWDQIQKKENPTQTVLSNKGNILAHVCEKPGGRPSCMGWNGVPTASSRSPQEDPHLSPGSNNLLRLYTVAMEMSSFHCLNCDCSSGKRNLPLHSEAWD